MLWNELAVAGGWKVIVIGSLLPTLTRMRPLKVEQGLRVVGEGVGDEADCVGQHPPFTSAM